MKSFLVLFSVFVSVNAFSRVDIDDVIAENAFCAVECVQGESGPEVQRSGCDEGHSCMGPYFPKDFKCESPEDYENAALGTCKEISWQPGNIPLIPRDDSIPFNSVGPMPYPNHRH